MTKKIGFIAVSCFSFKCKIVDSLTLHQHGAKMFLKTGTRWSGSLTKSCMMNLGVAAKS